MVAMVVMAVVLGFVLIGNTSKHLLELNQHYL